MRLRYTVHSCAAEAPPATVKVRLADGSDAEGVTPGRVVVELVSPADEHGHTFRLATPSAEEHDAVLALFAPGSRVRADFSRDEE